MSRPSLSLARAFALLIAIAAFAPTRAAAQASAPDLLSCVSEYDNAQSTVRRWATGGLVHYDKVGVHHFHWCIPTAPANARIEITATQVGGSASPGWGIGFGGTRQGTNIYIFGIDGNGAVGVHRGGGLSGIAVPYRVHPAVRRQLGEPNQLAIETRGGHARFFVNGTEVFDLRESRDFAGHLSLGHSVGQTVLWQGLRISSLASATVADEMLGGAPTTPSPVPAATPAATPTATPTAPPSPTATPAAGMRTSTGLTLPLRAGSHVSAGSQAGRYTRTADAASNVITYRVQQPDDLQEFYITSIGDVPARVRLEFTGAVTGCSDATMGIAFGGRIAGNSMLFTLAGINSQGTGGVFDFGPSGPRQVGNVVFNRGAQFRHRFVVDVNGPVVHVSIDGGPAQRTQLDHDAVGFIGISAAGGGCVTSIANLTASPLP